MRVARAVLVALGVAAPVSAVEPGVVVWVLGPDAAVPEVTLPQVPAPTVFASLGLRPRPPFGDSRAFLDSLSAVRRCYESGDALAGCVSLLDAAVARLPGAVEPAAVASLVDGLAFAAQVYSLAGRPELARSVAVALVRMAPGVALDPAVTPPEVVSVVNEARGTVAPVTLAWDGAAPSGCELVVGSQVVLPTQPVSRAADGAYVQCPDVGGTWLLTPVHALGASIRVASWEPGLELRAESMVSPSVTRARAFAEVLAARYPWAIAVAPASAGYELWAYGPGGKGVRVTSTSDGLMESVEQALAPAPEPAPVVLTPLEPAARRRPWWHWTLIGLGGAALVGGGVAHGMAADTIEDEINRGIDSMSTLEGEKIAFTTLYTVGGVALLTGTILAIIGESPDEER